MAVLTSRGIYLPLQKAPAADRPIEELENNPQILLPLSLSGETGACVLKPYTSVLAGQVVVRPKTSDGVPVISPVSGVYSGQKTVENPFGEPLCCLVLDCMDTRRPAPAHKTDTAALSAEKILDIARQNAVTDELDGRYVCEKLREWAAEGCDVLVGDAVENQPYASAAWEVLNESVEQVLEGLRLAARVVGAEQFHIAVQPLPGNHRRALRQRLGDDTLLFQVRRKYPAVRYVKKPFGSRVRRIGVQALLALYRAAAFGEPHTTGVVTVTGDAVSTPLNLRVPFGTPASALFKRCGLSADPTGIVFGDCMTGPMVTDADTPILPRVTCLLALTDPPRPRQEVCVGCGRCVQVCHADLLPFAIARQAARGQTDLLTGLCPQECDGCGACAAVCPAGQELTQQVLAAGQFVKKQKEETPHE